MRQSASLVLNPITVYSYGFLFNCTTVAGLPRSGKKFWKMKKFPGQGKVRELHFQSGKFKKMKKVMKKSENFNFFPKKMLVNRLLEILVSIICKQFMFRSIPFLIFRV